MTTAEKKRRTHQRYLRRRDRLYAQGLTARGVPRQLRTWPNLRAQKFAQQRVRRQENVARGLTGAGQPRKNKIWSLGRLTGYERERVRIRLWMRQKRAALRAARNPVAAAWKALRDTMEIPRPDFQTALERGALLSFFIFHFSFFIPS